MYIITLNFTNTIINRLRPKILSIEEKKVPGYTPPPASNYGKRSKFSIDVNLNFYI